MPKDEIIIKEDVKKIGHLKESIVSKIRNNVNNVSTKPTPRAARNSAMVLIAATV
jgi:hypothetical protein